MVMISTFLFLINIQPVSSIMFRTSHGIVHSSSIQLPGGFEPILPGKLLALCPVRAVSLLAWDAVLGDNCDPVGVVFTSPRVNL